MRPRLFNIPRSENALGDLVRLDREIGHRGGLYEVVEILEARDCLGYRFYLVKWKGYSTKKNSWILALWADGCVERLDGFWKKYGLCADTAAIPESPWTDAKGKVKLQYVGGAAGSMHENKTGRLT